ncbi:MAG TPA: dTDP-4-dehydrorhamnose 3,5-epimerase, partial [Paraburkholderia sp.]
MDRCGTGAETRGAAREERLWKISVEHSYGARCMGITVTATALPDVKIIEPKVFGDARGFFF